MAEENAREQEARKCLAETPHTDDCAEYMAETAYSCRCNRVIRAMLAYAANPSAGELLVTVARIETVTGDFMQDEGEPIWRIEIDGNCADFDFPEAANNVALAINRRIESALATRAENAQVGIMPIAHAIADGFSDGNEQFDEAPAEQQARYLSAALAVHVSGTFPTPPPSTTAVREEVARELAEHLSSGVSGTGGGDMDDCDDFDSKHPAHREVYFEAADAVLALTHNAGIARAIKYLRDLDLAEKPATQGHSAVWLAERMERDLLAPAPGEES